MDGGSGELDRVADLPESFRHGIALHCSDCNFSEAFTCAKRLARSLAMHRGRRNLLRLARYGDRSSSVCPACSSHAPSKSGVICGVGLSSGEPCFSRSYKLPRPAYLRTSCYRASPEAPQNAPTAARIAARKMCFACHRGDYEADGRHRHSQHCHGTCEEYFRGNWGGGVAMGWRRPGPCLLGRVAERIPAEGLCRA